jgi:hypothetical protein
MPPFTKPGNRTARKLYDQTSAIAAAQDAKLDCKPDPVNAPQHYSLAGREAIDVIESVAATVPDPVEAVLTSHALKYLMRWPRKGGITDLRKCQWYLARLIASVEAADCKARQSAALAELVREGQAMGFYANADTPAKSPNAGELDIDRNAHFPTRVQLDAGIPAESSYLASFGPNGSRLATADEIDNLRSVLSAEELKGFGIGDVPRHPMHAEALRDEYERGSQGTGV